MSDLEFQKVLVVSSGHITQGEMAYLEWLALEFEKTRDDDAGFEVLNYGPGILLYVYSESGQANEDEDEDRHLARMFPEWERVGASVKTLYALARKHDCTYLKLDRDGPEIKGLELFDW